jgi:hypothetical protein
MKYKISIIAIIALALTACEPKAKREYGYDAIMPPELADCKVFYISNVGTGLYLTRCGLETNTSWSETCGKGCTRHYDSSVVGIKP